MKRSQSHKLMQLWDSNASYSRLKIVHKLVCEWGPCLWAAADQNSYGMREQLQLEMLIKTPTPSPTPPPPPSAGVRVCSCMNINKWQQHCDAVHLLFSELYCWANALIKKLFKQGALYAVMSLKGVDWQMWHQIPINCSVQSATLFPAFYFLFFWVAMTHSHELYIINDFEVWKD